MTNKVNPFYIKITDDMTPQMVQDAFDKCVDTGAVDGDCIEGVISKHEYQDAYEFGVHELFGVSEAGYTRFYNMEAWFGSGAQEITLDQLNEWLGLESKVEWKNGDMTYVKDCTHDEIKFIGLSGNSAVAVCECITSDRRVILDKFWVSGLLKEKPEAPEQKAERERMEAIEAMCEHIDRIQYGEAFDAASALYDAGYRKQ